MTDIPTQPQNTQLSDTTVTPMTNGVHTGFDAPPPPPPSPAGVSAATPPAGQGVLGSENQPTPDSVSDQSPLEFKSNPFAPKPVEPANTQPAVDAPIVTQPQVSPPQVSEAPVAQPLSSSVVSEASVAPPVSVSSVSEAPVAQPPSSSVVSEAPVIAPASASSVTGIPVVTPPPSLSDTSDPDMSKDNKLEDLQKPGSLADELSKTIPANDMPPTPPATESGVGVAKQPKSLDSLLAEKDEKGDEEDLPETEEDEDLADDRVGSLNKMNGFKVDEISDELPDGMGGDLEYYLRQIEEALKGLKKIVETKTKKNTLRDQNEFSAEKADDDEDKESPDDKDLTSGYKI